MQITVPSRCADLDRLDTQATQADRQLKEATARLRDARASKKSQEDIQKAAQEVQSARLAVTKAHQVAKQQGSGSPGDRLKSPSETGATVDLYA